MAAKTHVVVETGADTRSERLGRDGDSPTPQSMAEKRKSDGTSTETEPVAKKMVSAPENSDLSGSSAKKFSISLGNTGKAEPTDRDSKTQLVNPVKLSMPSKQEPHANLKKASASVASAFNDDDDSEEEEMPPEAKMRMKNIGRNTPTAAGPNSFGKSRLGFCDRQKVLERKIREQIDAEDKE